MTGAPISNGGVVVVVVVGVSEDPLASLPISHPRVTPSRVPDTLGMGLVSAPGATKSRGCSFVGSVESGRA